MKQNIFKVITYFLFLMGEPKHIEVTITRRSYMNIKKGTLFVDPECVRCFGRIEKIEDDKAVFLSYKPIPKDQFLLYTKKCCKVTGDTSSLPVAVLFRKTSDGFSLQVCTREEQKEYESQPLTFKYQIPNEICTLKTKPQDAPKKPV